MVFSTPASRNTPPRNETVRRLGCSRVTLTFRHLQPRKSSATLVHYQTSPNACVMPYTRLEAKGLGSGNGGAMLYGVGLGDAGWKR